MEPRGEILGYEGHVVVDCVGQRLGRVEEICTDEATDGPQWARVKLDALETASTFVPLIGAKPAGEDLRIAYTRETVISALETDSSKLHLYYGRASEGLELPAGRGQSPLGPPPRWP